MLAGLLFLLVFGFRFADDGFVHASPALQETPGYDAPTETGGQDDPGYDAPPTDTPSGSGSSTETASPTNDVPPTAVPLPTEMPTVPLTSTLPPDVFRTEDSEMNGALTTPAGTETPGPTMTPYHTPTATKTPPKSHLSARSGEKKGGFIPNWGMFWIGFSLPVLGACGVVLYLLDRRPDLFRRKG